MKRKVDLLGRISIPVEYRRALQIECSSEVEIDMAGEYIYITNAHNYCIFCDARDEELIHFEGRNICKTCFDKLKKLTMFN